MTFKNRSNCGQLGLADVGRTVEVTGWVDALRDHGELLFIHLRDRSGIIQVVFNPGSTTQEVCGIAATLRNECCVALSGRVVRRAEGTENPNIETGVIEVVAESLAILSRAEPLPFQISEKAMVAGVARKDETVSEDLRMQYRYLDLRRPSMQDNLIRRHRIIRSIREYLDEQGFIEVETPVLT
jgi:aspartyl-tRNA synthetase